MKSFKQYLKEYASAVRNKEIGMSKVPGPTREEWDIEEEPPPYYPSTEGVLRRDRLVRLHYTPDQQLLDALGRDWWGGAPRGAVMPEIAVPDPDHPASGPSGRYDNKRAPGTGAIFGNLYDGTRNYSNTGVALLSAMRAAGMTFNAKWPESVDIYDARSKDVNDILGIKPTPIRKEGEDQKMLNTIAGGSLLDDGSFRRNAQYKSDSGSALLSAMRAAGMTFDAVWPLNVDRYDELQQRARDIMDGK